ncbi:MAG: septum formation protein Maf [Oscillospiraceae bacterium]|nr:septum formation protein Maf [Oscillospiraceae bacterium]
MDKYILASNSPRRQELFRLISEDFLICPTNAEEVVPEGTPAEDVPLLLSEIKAEAAAAEHPDDIVIGCDTVVIHKGKIYGKPADREDAFRTLKTLSGECHTVVTGVTLIQKSRGKKTSFSQKSVVKFCELSDEEIESYIDSGDPFDKAGSYGIQGRGALIVNGISGDYYNIMGLPVGMLYRKLKKFREG